ncbi:DsrE family protein [Aquisalimonas asiatica]|uniref:Predicted peroxiredoxin n=1 Tax=Aquisalimonas asiatica TaxID=406100 RepID=A0A1H8UW29_9GAMM|nr:DsrE family protein [Aquisalimonas asiatica]SEP07385.1 Predicted peroxiredoxin [Aquisalimonas asiatica]
MMIPQVRTLLIAGLTALGLLAGPVQADDDGRDILMLVNSDEDQVQGMAMSMASELAQRDHSVHIILCGEAAELALEENIPSALAPRDISAKELMQEAMSFGATAEVCHLFLPNSGYRQYEEEDLLEEVTVNNPEEQAEMISDGDTRVISY